MTHQDDDLARKIADLEGRLREVETLQALTLRILATTKPLDSVLDQYGATQSQQQALYCLLDELAVRSRAAEHEQPTYPYFLAQFDHLFHALREDRTFVALVIDTLRIERAAYRELYAYMVAHGWLTAQT